MDYAHIALLAAAAVVAAQQILKLKVVPIAFANRYPVPTNILLSVVAAVLAVWTDNVRLVAWTDWLLFVGTVSVVAAITYNQLIGRSAELKEMEGEG